jgi:hypothetical protein
MVQNYYHTGITSSKRTPAKDSISAVSTTRSSISSTTTYTSKGGSLFSEFSRILLGSSMNKRTLTNETERSKETSNTKRTDKSSHTLETLNLGCSQNKETSENTNQTSSTSTNKFSPLHTSTNIERKRKAIPVYENKKMSTSDSSKAIKLVPECPSSISDALNPSFPHYLSEYESKILKSTSPIQALDQNVEKIKLKDQSGIWINKAEADQWTGLKTLNEYLINEDDDPCVITKTTNTRVEYIQGWKVFFLNLADWVA